VLSFLRSRLKLYSHLQEQDDVQLTDYLTMLLQQMEAWTTVS